MLNINTQQKIYFVLRLAVAMCFIGHGAFGIITKPVWCNYFAVFGIGKTLAYGLMPWIGAVDIALGIAMLIYPVRAVPLWLIFWGLFTAALRPLSGEPIAELIERAGNFGAPLALLLLCGGSATFKGWFRLMEAPRALSLQQLNKIKLCLKAVVFLLLAGHGWLNCIAKPGLLNQYHAIGFNNTISAAFWVGIAEIGASFIIWIDSLSPLLLLFLVWKILSELFYPHYELFEFVERGGSYGAIMALWLVMHKLKLPLPVLNRKPAFN